MCVEQSGRNANLIGKSSKHYGYLHFLPVAMLRGIATCAIIHSSIYVPLNIGHV